MSRPKGSKNNVPTNPISCGINPGDVMRFREEQEKSAPIKTDPKYIILADYASHSELMKVVDWWIDYGYVCQGGVSVTNYRGLDGNIVMVYAQAMVKREG
jgi:hypothetical protein